MNGLDHFEALAEQLVEGTFERLFRPRLHPSNVARRLARAMEDGRVNGDGGQILLPNRCWVLLNLDDFAALEAGGDMLQAELTHYLERLAAESGAHFSGSLRVGLHSVSDLAAGQLEVRVAHAPEPGDVDDTHGIQAATRSETKAGGWSLQLGERLFPLGEPVVRLGRALSNDVILDDRRISRRHAQLRWREGAYRLSDMGSRGGTTLNSRPIPLGEEASLAAGDVISLAGVMLTVHAEARQAEADLPPNPPTPSQEG